MKQTCLIQTRMNWNEIEILEANGYMQVPSGLKKTILFG